MPVSMKHTDAERQIEVPESAVRIYEKSGWQVVKADQAPAGEPAGDAKAAAPVVVAEPEAPKAKPDAEDPKPDSTAAAGPARRDRKEK